MSAEDSPTTGFLSRRLSERMSADLRSVYDQLRAGPKLRVVVLSVDGESSFDVPASALPGVVDYMVLERFGRQANGESHIWQTREIEAGSN